MHLGNTLSCATSCYGFNIELNNTLNHIADLGFRNVEIMSIPNWFEHLEPEKMSIESIQKLKETLNSLSLKPTAISGHCELGHKKEKNQLKDRILLAASLGIEQVVIGSGEIKSTREEENFFQSLSENIATAEENNVILSLETGGNYIPTGKKLATILEDVNSPFLKATYDAANVMSWSKVDPVEDIKNVLPFLSHIHIKEYSNNLGYFPPIGEGIIEFDRLFSLLYKEGYTGDFSFEIDCFKCNDNEATNKLEKSISYLKNNTAFFKYFS